MTWIRTIPMEEADETLRKAMEAARDGYPQEYASSVSPGGDSVVASHALIPGALHHIFAGFAAMMSPDLPLNRAQHEMIATMVSVGKPVFLLTGIARRVSAYGDIG